MVCQHVRDIPRTSCGCGITRIILGSSMMAHVLKVLWLLLLLLLLLLQLLLGMVLSLGLGLLLLRVLLGRCHWEKCIELWREVESRHDVVW